MVLNSAMDPSGDEKKLERSEPSVLRKSPPLLELAVDPMPDVLVLDASGCPESDEPPPKVSPPRYMSFWEVAFWFAEVSEVLAAIR
jgi:hypothetical protein